MFLGAYVPQCTCGGQRITWASQQAPLPVELSLAPKRIAFNTRVACFHDSANSRKKMLKIRSNAKSDMRMDLKVIRETVGPGAGPWDALEEDNVKFNYGV